MPIACSTPWSLVLNPYFEILSAKWTKWWSGRPKGSTRFSASLDTVQSFFTVFLSSIQPTLLLSLCSHSDCLSSVLPSCLSETWNTQMLQVPVEILKNAWRRRKSWHRSNWAFRVADKWHEITKRCCCSDGRWKSHTPCFAWCSRRRWAMQSRWRWWTRWPASWPGPSDATWRRSGWQRVNTGYWFERGGETSMLTTWYGLECSQSVWAIRGTPWWNRKSRTTAADRKCSGKNHFITYHILIYRRQEQPPPSKPRAEAVCDE